MPNIDLSDYESRMSIHHERQCRVAAFCAAICRFCSTRRCRRTGSCLGPMEPSPHQEKRNRIQREIGLSGMACAKLPRCVANAHSSRLVRFEEKMEEIATHLYENRTVCVSSIEKRLKAARRRRNRAQRLDRQTDKAPMQANQPSADHDLTA